MRYIPTLSIALMLLAAPTALAQDAETQEQEETIDINWFAKELQRQAIFADEDAAANLNVPAISSTRFTLESREQLEVFLFEDGDKASSIAYQLAGLNPRADVYLREGLVVIHLASSERSYAQDLRDIMGDAI